MCLCQILVLLCTCFAMSTKMAANCKPPIAHAQELMKLLHLYELLYEMLSSEKGKKQATIKTTVTMTTTAATTTPIMTPVLLLDEACTGHIHHASYFLFMYTIQ